MPVQRHFGRPSELTSKRKAGKSSKFFVPKPKVKHIPSRREKRENSTVDNTSVKRQRPE